MFPNKRGNAHRSADKSERVKTHIPLLRFVVSLVRDRPMSTAIEHGMGIGSTPFLHSLEGISRIFSLENDPRWRSCSSCGKDGKYHEISGWPGEDPVSSIPDLDPASTLALVDGPADERIRFLISCLSHGIEIVVEHDAETLTQQEVDVRREAARSAGYLCYQWINDNPESILYSRDRICRDGLVIFSP